MGKSKFLRSVKDGSEKSKATGAGAVDAAARNQKGYLGTAPAGKMGRKPLKGGAYDDRK